MIQSVKLSLKDCATISLESRSTLDTVQRLLRPAGVTIGYGRGVAVRSRATHAH